MLTEELRNPCAPDRRTQPLCPRCRLGPIERVHCDTIFGPLCSHLFSEDQGRPLHAPRPRRQAPQARQPRQNRSPASTDLLQQPSAARDRVSIGARRGGCRPWCIYRLARALSAGDPNICGAAHEPTQRDKPQSEIVLLIETFGLACAIDAAAGRDAYRSLT